MKSLLLIILTFTFSLGFTQYLEANLIKHSFKNQIIRSYAVNPIHQAQMLVGLKGDSLGDGKVYISEDYGSSWTALNNGLALSPKCEDIQALCIIDSLTFLAGTWKNGIYISKDRGVSFKKIEDFPAKDIRAIKKGHQTTGLVYASTTTHGVMKSLDNGTTWYKSPILDNYTKLAAWSLLIDPNNDSILYITSFTNGIQASFDQGISWNQILHQKELFFWDLAIDNKGKIYAVGNNDSLSLIVSSNDYGTSWKTNNSAPLASINSIDILYNSYSTNEQLLIGSWDQGFFLGNSDNYFNSPTKWIKANPTDSIGTTKIHSNEKYIYSFSWGDGLKQYERTDTCSVYATTGVTNHTFHGAHSWIIKSECDFQEMEFYLFDRWGSVQFQDTSTLESVMTKFDTFYEEHELSDNTYVWYLKVKYLDQTKTVTHQGYVTVIK